MLVVGRENQSLEESDLELPANRYLHIVRFTRGSTKIHCQARIFRHTVCPLHTPFGCLATGSFRRSTGSRSDSDSARERAWNKDAAY